MLQSITLIDCRARHCFNQGLMYLFCILLSSGTTGASPGVNTGAERGSIIEISVTVGETGKRSLDLHSFFPEAVLGSNPAIPEPQHSLS